MLLPLVLSIITSSLIQVSTKSFDNGARVGMHGPITISPNSESALPESTAAEDCRPLKIAQVATLQYSVPPKKYGGTERVVSYLTEELVRQGHNVTLFAKSDSTTSARLLSVESGSLPDLMAKVSKLSNEFDIMHFHSEEFFEYIEHISEPTLTTIHWRVFQKYLEIFKNHSQIPLVAISNHHRASFPPEANIFATIYHGMPSNLLPYDRTLRRPGAGEYGYLAFLGRISRDKGPVMAIEVAIRTGIPLKIAAQINQDDYWLKEVKPLVDQHPDLIEMVGEVDDVKKADFLGKASALLFPIDWAEPFGLVMIEAMSTGTPVIARRRGSVPEVVKDGLTGFIFETVDEAVEAVHKIGKLDRARIRKEFERRFTVETMAKNYVKTYRKQMEKHQKFSCN